jgi:predicted NAD/FAD-dependent oxidoreductase
VEALRVEDDLWVAETEDGSRHAARSCILTPPVPQTLALLTQCGIPLSSEHREVLEGIVYEPCIAVMAICDDAPDLPDNGVLEFERGNLRRIMDNNRKGISPDAQAITIHASGAFSRQYFDADDDSVARQLIDEAELIMRVAVVSRQLHRWRYSQVLTPHPRPTLSLSSRPPLAVAGDAFGVNGVEGAARSGMQAAQLIMRQLL